MKILFILALLFSSTNFFAQILNGKYLCSLGQTVGEIKFIVNDTSIYVFATAGNVLAPAAGFELQEKKWVGYLGGSGLKKLNRDNFSLVIEIEDSTTSQFSISSQRALYYEVYEDKYKYDHVEIKTDKASGEILTTNPITSGYCTYSK